MRYTIVVNKQGDDSYKQCCLFSDPVICLYIIVLLVHALYFQNKYCFN